MNSVTSRRWANRWTGVDGPLKVQGKAQYVRRNFPLPGLLYGSVVNSTIASGQYCAYS